MLLETQHAGYQTDMAQCSPKTPQIRLSSDWLLMQGYGTVRFESTSAAQSAINDFHGTELEGRTLTVKLDKFA